MSISTFQAHYHQLQNQLQCLRLVLSDPSEPQGKFSQQGQALMQLWQQELAAESGEMLPETVYATWRSLHTELHRELRLINVDLMFLENTRSAITKDKKIQEIGDRQTKLEQYCEQILQLSDPHKPAA